LRQRRFTGSFFSGQWNQAAGLVWWKERAHSRERPFPDSRYQIRTLFRCRQAEAANLMTTKQSPTNKASAVVVIC
jgi:hypothetical protein